MNDKEIIQMPKDNPIKIIKCGDIEIPVEYLRQTTVNVNGDDYIRVQQENERVKDNWNKLREYIKETKLKEFEKDYGKRYGETFTQAEIVVCNMILDKMQELEGSDSNE